MKKYLVAVLTLVLSGFVSASLIEQDIYTNDMSSLDNWSLKGSCGISVVDNSAVEFTGWKSILSTQEIWTDTGLAIQDETDYVLTVTGATHSLFKSPLELSFSGVDNNSWSTITSRSSRWSKRNEYSDLTLSFSTVGQDNDMYLGQSLGIKLDAGWLNSLTVSNVRISAISHAANAVPEPATVALIAFGSIPILLKRKPKIK